MPLKIASPPKKFPSIGRCIYCGSTAGPFGDEHIIPHGLAGNVIFEKASCKDCEKATSAVERVCLRNMLLPLRARLGIAKRRRPKTQRPKELTVELIMPDGKLEKRMLPTEKHPLCFALLRFDAPDILLGAPPKESFTGKRWHYVNRLEADAMLPLYRAKGFEIGRFHPGLFSRMLAKIAHAFAVANQGPEAFTPFLTDLILRGSKTPSYFVGGDLKVPPAVPDVAHTLHLKAVSGEPPGTGIQYLVVDIRLFAWLGAPQYRVVVGEWKGA
jgi:hypothetical protein